MLSLSLSLLRAIIHSFFSIVSRLITGRIQACPETTEYEVKLPDAACRRLRLRCHCVRRLWLDIIHRKIKTEMLLLHLAFLCLVCYMRVRDWMFFRHLCVFFPPFYPTVVMVPLYNYAIQIEMDAREFFAALYFSALLTFVYLANKRQEAFFRKRQRCQWAGEDGKTVLYTVYSVFATYSLNSV